ncbi:hypothetical protein PSPO01_15663 [Paraphaeosphaeria sporulosa]
MAADLAGSCERQSEEIGSDADALSTGEPEKQGRRNRERRLARLSSRIWQRTEAEKRRCAELQLCAAGLPVVVFLALPRGALSSRNHAPAWIVAQRGYVDNLQYLSGELRRRFVVVRSGCLSTTTRDAALKQFKVTITDCV